MYIEIILAILILILGFVIGMIVGETTTKIRLKGKVLNRENVVNCFKDVDWTTQTFSSNGHTMKAKDGQEHFYKVRSIDQAIKNLNNLMDGK